MGGVTVGGKEGQSDAALAEAPPSAAGMGTEDADHETRLLHQRMHLATEIGNLLSLGAEKIALQRLLANYHPADVAEVLEDLPGDTFQRILHKVSPEQRAELLDESPETEVEDWVEGAQAGDLAQVIERMPPDDAADLLKYASLKKVEKILGKIQPERARAIRELRQYPPDTAGGIMTNEFFHVRPDASAATILSELRAAGDDVENITDIMVTKSSGKFLGVIKMDDLLAAPAEAAAATIMEQATVAVGPTTDQEICARYMTKYGLMVLPVLDPKRRLIGIITFDDILEVLDEEASEDMYRMAGVGARNPLEEGPIRRACKRLPWFLVTLTGMSFLAYAISLYQVTLDKVAALSFFIPAIMGLGGNVGIQAATITVRGLGTGEIDFGDFWWILRRELTVALIIALVMSSALGGVSWVMTGIGLEGAPPPGHGAQHQVRADDPEAARPDPAGGPRSLMGEPVYGVVPRFPLTVGLAMFGGIMGAVLLGTAIPMVCHRVGVDPALASGPFVTTLIDIGTQIVYLTLATFLLLAWS